MSKSEFVLIIAVVSLLAGCRQESSPESGSLAAPQGNVEPSPPRGTKSPVSQVANTNTLPAFGIDRSTTDAAALQSLTTFTLVQNGKNPPAASETSGTDPLLEGPRLLAVKPHSTADELRVSVATLHSAFPAIAPGSTQPLTREDAVRLSREIAVLGQNAHDTSSEVEKDTGYEVWDRATQTELLLHGIASPAGAEDPATVTKKAQGYITEIDELLSRPGAGTR